MSEISKGRSPFYPGQPVPVELFVGRHEQIERILTRGAGQVKLGKPVAFFTQGEYGIGKSSIAAYVQRRAELEHQLHPIYVSLGGCKDLEDVAKAVFQATYESGVFNPARSEKIQNWLSKYVGKQGLLGITINLEALKTVTPSLANHLSMLTFLKEAYSCLIDTGVKGIFLAIDEINGIASDPLFANFIKGLIDSNAISKEPLPLLLMLCGVEEKRRALIKAHQPIDRIFDVIEIAPMSEKEMRDFFNKAFGSVRIIVESLALSQLVYYSAGFPKIMHLVGDAAFWIDKDGIIDIHDAMAAVTTAADEVGRKFVDHKVYAAIKTDEYRSILQKIANNNRVLVGMHFLKSEVESALTEAEKGKLNNFLQKMKRLKVLKSGELKGEYIFNSRMEWLYIYLQGAKEAKK